MKLYAIGTHVKTFKQVGSDTCELSRLTTEPRRWGRLGYVSHVYTKPFVYYEIRMISLFWDGLYAYTHDELLEAKDLWELQ